MVKAPSKKTKKVVSLRTENPELVEKINKFLGSSTLKVSGGSMVITEDDEKTFFIFLEKINGSERTLPAIIGRKIKEEFDFPNLVLDGTVV